MKHLQKRVAILLIGFCLFDSTSIKSQSFQTLQIKEFHDDMGEFQMDMNYYSPLTSLTKASALEPMSYKLESYIRMYQTTRDKAYLYKFIKHIIKIQSLRGTYSGSFTCEGCADHGALSWSPSFYQNGIILWPMAHFVHLIRKEEPALQSVSLNPHQDIDLSSIDYSNFGEFADWLAGRAKETIEYYRNNGYWWSDDEAFRGSTDDNHALAINMQSAFGATLLYMGLAWDPGYMPYARKMADLYKTSFFIADFCTGLPCLPDIYINPLLRHNKINNSYWWYHSGWSIPMTSCFCSAFTQQPKLNGIGGFLELYEDISHGAQTLIFPLVAYKHQLSSGGTPYFTSIEMTRFRNTMAKNVWGGTITSFWNAIIGGTHCDVPSYNCLPNYHRRATLAWMPFYEFDIYDANPKPLYEILMDYYEFDVHDKVIPASRGMTYYGLAEVAAAQWDKECPDLTLKNRKVVYHQDFFSQNNLIINPTALNDFNPANPNSFADPVIIDDEFTIESGITVNMSAKDKITLKPGFHAKEGSSFHAYIDENIICNTSSSKMGNSITTNNSDELIEDNTEADLKYENNFASYPNPFNNSIIFEYQLMKGNNVTLTIQNVFGKEIRRIVDNEYKEKGSYQIEFDASDLPAGIYFYTLTTNNNKTTRKIIKVE